VNGARRSCRALVRPVLRQPAAVSAPALAQLRRWRGRRGAVQRLRAALGGRL
jgi:hypothetical protein